METEPAERHFFLDGGQQLAVRIGLAELTVGRLATELDLPRSRVARLFPSDEALQLAVVDAVAEAFATTVLRPALELPRGEPRVRELIDRWLRWGAVDETSRGCFFVTATVEFDDAPGPLRDRLAARQRDAIASLSRVIQGAVNEGHFRPSVDPDQLAFEVYSVALGYRLFGAPDADDRARAAVFALFDGVRTRSAA
jgi:AcrR family transcriptional regulator